MINLLKNIGHLVLSALAITYNAYVMTILWAWFIVATFGLPVLSVPVAVGVVAIAALFKSVNRDNADREDAIVFGHTFGFLKPTACLAVGWVALKFV